MKRQSHYTRCQTLRLDEYTDDLLASVAYERRTSKVSIIRAAIRQSLGIQSPMPRRIHQEIAR